jgi:hypothetical protein
MNASEAYSSGTQRPSAHVSFSALPQLTLPYLIRLPPLLVHGKEVKDCLLTAKQRTIVLQDYVNSSPIEGLDQIATMSMKVEGLQQLIALSRSSNPRYHSRRSEKGNQ